MFRNTLRTLVSFPKQQSVYDTRKSVKTYTTTTQSSSSGFDALSSILNRPSPSTSFSRPRPPTEVQVRRGYDPSTLPPKMDPALELMTNLLMRDGKKSQAQRRMSKMLESIQRATNLPPVPLIHRALSLVSPAVRVTSVVISRRAKDVPKALDERQRIGQAIRWIYRAAERGRKAGVPRETRIAREILSVLEGEEGGSEVYKWLEERHRSAMAARAQLSTNSGRR